MQQLKKRLHTQTQEKQATQQQQAAFVPQTPASQIQASLPSQKQKSSQVIPATLSQHEDVEASQEALENLLTVGQLTASQIQKHNVEDQEVVEEEQEGALQAQATAETSADSSELLTVRDATQTISKALKNAEYPPKDGVYPSLAALSHRMKVQLGVSNVQELYEYVFSNDTVTQNPKSLSEMKKLDAKYKVLLTEEENEDGSVSNGASERFALAPEQWIHVQHELANYMLPRPPMDALSMLQDTSTQYVLSTGDITLDTMFAGGFRSGLTIEISGESGSGKSNLCLQLLLQNSLNGYESFYLITEKVFSSDRLMQMLEERTSYQTSQAQSAVTDRIKILKASTTEEMFNCLNLIGNVAKPNKSRLLIIDSVAALFRVEFEKNFQERSKKFYQLISMVNNLAVQYRMVTIFTNQVTAKFNDTRGGALSALLSSSTSTSASAALNFSSPLFGQNNLLEQKTPSLGLSWSNCVKMRVFLTKSTRDVQLDAVQWSKIAESCAANNDGEEVQRSAKRQKVGDSYTRRTITVVYSPYLRNQQCTCIIRDSGIHGLHDTIQPLGEK